MISDKPKSDLKKKRLHNRVLYEGLEKAENFQPFVTKICGTREGNMYIARVYYVLFIIKITVAKAVLDCARRVSSGKESIYL